MKQRALRPAAEKICIYCGVMKPVRGLLCHQCNVSIGLLKDDPAIIRSLLLYVETA